jgi:hypothetical protein
MTGLATGPPPLAPRSSSTQPLLTSHTHPPPNHQRLCHRQPHRSLSACPPPPPPPPKGFAIVNLAKYCILIPLVHKWVLGRGLAVVALSFYALYSLVYCLAVLGVV